MHHNRPHALTILTLLFSFERLLAGTVVPSSRPVPMPQTHPAMGTGTSFPLTEAQIADLPLSLPMSEVDWRNIIGEYRYRFYLIKPKDTLSQISQRFFHTPFYWAKLWEVNSRLTNPHLIYPGRHLAFVNMADLEKNVIHVPVVKLSPFENELDHNRVADLERTVRFHPRILVVENDDEIAGRIGGSYAHSEGLSSWIPIYVRLKAPAKEGEKFSIVHPIRVMPREWDPEAGRLGTVVRLMGTVILDEDAQEGVWTRAHLSDTFDWVRRNDWLIPEQKVISWNPEIQDPPKDFRANIVSGEDFRYRYAGQGQIVLIDKGQKDGMKVGYYFGVKMDRDPRTREQEEVQPFSKGDIQVIYTAASSSIGYVVKSEFPILTGDALSARQNFPRPKPIKIQDPPKIVELDDN